MIRTLERETCGSPELVQAYAQSSLKKNAIVAQAIDSGPGILMVVGLDGKILVVEGGGADHLGLHIGKTEGQDIRTWGELSFDEALSKLAQNEKSSISNQSVTFVTSRKAPVGATDSQKKFWEGAWVTIFSYLRSPSGKPIGVTIHSIPLEGSISKTGFSECPLGSCVLEDIPRSRRERK